MTIFAHTLSASVLSLMIAKVDPTQSNYLLIALAVPAALDLDHVYFLIKDRKMFKGNGLVGNLHKARSIMHEMVGVLIMGTLSLSLLTLRFDPKLSTIIFFSYLIHVIEDMVMGISIPFSPISLRECYLFKFSVKQKIVADICLIIISLILWTNYLKG